MCMFLCSNFQFSLHNNHLKVNKSLKKQEEQQTQPETQIKSLNAHLELNE